MHASQLIDVALKAGELLLRSGAEIYRVEDTIIRIFRAYNRRCDCFVLLTGIFISTRGDGEKNISVIRRIRDRGFDLNRIELVNSFSRSLNLNRISYRDALITLDNIERKAPDHNLAIRILAAGFTAFVYTLIFRGDLSEAATALLIAVFIYILKNKISEIGFIDFFNYFICGMIVAGISLLSASVFTGVNIYKVIIGGIMILLPGMSITNGVKDALHGDIVSSLYRLAEALFTLIGIGAGVGFILSTGLQFK